MNLTILRGSDPSTNFLARHRHPDRHTRKIRWQINVAPTEVRPRPTVGDYLGTLVAYYELQKCTSKGAVDRACMDIGLFEKEKYIL